MRQIKTWSDRRMPLVAFAAISLALLSACDTTNSIPYKASTDNIIKIQQTLHASGKKVNLGTIELAAGVDENLLCRLMGPVKVAPGKTLSQYIREALQEELFMAQVYSIDAPATITGTIDALSFSSISPANWEISMKVSSNKAPGYAVSTNYRFNTSFTAPAACKNVADAFGPAVQQLLKQVVNHPEFATLAG